MSPTLPEAFLDAFPAALVVTDGAGIILQANVPAARRVRREPRDLVGETFFEAYGLPDGKTAFEGLRRAGGGAASLSIDLDVPDAVVRVRGFADGADARLIVLFEPAHADVRQRRVVEAWEAALALVREVRHEINNPLMGIMGQVELLQGRTDLTPPVAEKIASIERESGRIRAMAARLGEIKRV